VDVGFINSRVIFRHIMVLRKIKELLGMGGDDSSTRSDQNVVVQEESSPDTEAEAAVKGVDEGDADTGPDDGDEMDEPVAATTDADASTASLVDEEETEDHPESRAEPAEAAGPGAEEETTEVEEAEPETDAADVEETVEGATAEGPDIDEAEGTPVDSIKGIGPAYSERLGEVGIDSVEDLAAADAAALAERITVAEKTVAKWIDRANEQAD
jgi:predicted flap endonuclease-1-like 5' DNA nuclease